MRQRVLLRFGERARGAYVDGEGLVLLLDRVKNKAIAARVLANRLDVPLSYRSLDRLLCTHDRHLGRRLERKLDR